MKKVFLFFAAALLTAQVTRAQAPSIAPGQGFINGLGIGVPVGPNYSDASLHIKATPNSYYNSGNGQSLLYCETDNAPGDYMRLMNSKGGVGGTFAPWLMGTVVTDPSVGFHLGANLSTAYDVANTIPAMLFSVRRDFVPQTSQTYPGNGGSAIVSRPLFQWNNNSTSLMTMHPTTAANGDSRLAFGLGTTVPAFKFDLATPAANDGIRISNTGTTAAALRLKANSAGGHDWAMQSSGSGSGAGAGHLFFYDYTTNLYRFFVNGGSGNVGIGNNNGLTSVPQLKLDINTPSQNDGIRVTQTGNTSATLSLVGGSPANVGTAPGQSRRWSLHSTGAGNTNVGAGHLLFWDWTTNVERMRIHENGNVGINTTGLPGPSNIFHVKSRMVGGANQDPVRIETLNAATDNDVVTVDATGVLHTRSITSLPGSGISNSCTTVGQVPVVNSATGNLACSQITDNGTNVGINTTSPADRLHIVGPSMKLERNDPASGNQINALRIVISSNGLPSAVLNAGTINFTSLNLNPGSNPDMAFSANNIDQQIVLKNNGNLGVGTTTPGGQFELGLDQGRKPSTSTWTITSDARLKNIDGAYSKGLAEIMQLNPIAYHYKNVGDRKFDAAVIKTQSVGYAAQDVQKIFPEAVGKDADGYLNLNIHPILIAQVNAIKELKSELDTKETRIQALENEITAIKEMLQSQGRNINTAAVANTKTTTKVYPNPANGSSITIEHFTTNETPVYVSISDMQGRQVSTKQFNPCAHCTNKFALDITQLSNGTYTVSILNNGKTAVQKIVVAK